MHQRFLFVGLVLSFYLQLKGQSFDEKDFTRYTKLDGLSNNSITGIVQDSSGYIWIGTKKGLNRFDGRSFSNFFKQTENLPLPENSITSLTMQENEIIGSTSAGAFSYNTITRENKSFSVPVDSIIFFWTNQVWQTLKDNSGDYVLSTKTGLFVFNAEGKLISRYDHYVPQDAGRKELWFGNWLAALSDGRIFQENNLAGSFYNPKTKKIENNSFSKQTNLRQLLNSKIDENRISFYFGKDQLITPNTETGSLESYNLITGQYFSYSVPKDVITDIDWYSKVFFINDSLAALTSKVGGFYLLNFSSVTKKWSCDSRKTFPARYCTSFFSDRDGRLWIGTNDGLFKQNIRNSFFNVEDLSQQLPTIINTGIQSVFVTKEKIYVGLRNEGGLLILNYKTKRIERVVNLARHGLGSNSVNFIFHFNKDTLWLGTARGILWFKEQNASNGQLNMHGQPDWMYQTKTRNYLEDSEGDLWLSFGQLNSLLLFKRSERRFYDLSQNPLLKITFCFSILEDKNKNVWIAGDGLCRWIRQQKMIDTLIPFPNVSKELVNYMQLLDCDNKNNLWITSYDNEILQYDCNNNKMFLRLPENSMIDGHSLTNSGIINDHIWLGMANGISAFNINDYSIKQFNYSDGLPSAVATSQRKGSFYDPVDNRFYFGAGQYLISFVPDVHVSEKKLPLFSVELAGSNQLLSEKISLPYSKNSAELSLNAINFTDPEENRFAYKFLDENNENWRELNTKNVVVLSKLPPGIHRIQFKLYSINNRWPAQTRTVQIQIRPPLWKSPFFLLFAGVLFLLLIYFLYRNRVIQINRRANIDRLLAETEMKALHTQMNPHFIFNCLNSIKKMILDNENGKASRYLSKFAQLIRLTLTQSSKPFISLRNTIDYLNRYLEMEQIRTNRFTYKIKTSNDLNPEDIYIPPMLIQPFIENAIWHGDPAEGRQMEIQIRFFPEGNALICIVEDNGIGIEASLKKKEEKLTHHSVGIANIRQRIQVLNEKYNLKSTLTIDDKSNGKTTVDTGTIVTLSLPIKNSDT
jgi:ligand-binding sensor domain-containing protein/signal transduction histidine kinase